MILTRSQLEGVESREKKCKEINVFLHTISLDNIEESFADQVCDVELFKLQINEYSQRALLMAGPEDYIVLNSYPDREYLNFLSELGIGTTHILIPMNIEGSLSTKVLKDDNLLNSLRRLNKKNESVVIRPYISTDIEWKIAEKINGSLFGADPKIIKSVNSKRYLQKLLNELNIPATECAVVKHTFVVEMAEQLRKKHKKIVVKGDNSCGGSAVWTIRDQNEFNLFRTQVLKRKDNHYYLVEKMYDVEVSPNIQLEISKNNIEEIVITDQKLDEKLKHYGNTFPSRSGSLKTIQRYSMKICDKLRQTGYVGLIGIDFIETIDRDVFPVEINGRANTSSFAVKAIQKILPTSYFKKHFQIVINFQAGRVITFKELKSLIGEKNLFNKKTGGGILPYNVGCLSWGKFDALIVADTHSDTQYLLDLLYSLFPPDK